jgi:pteridine reductase
VTAKVALVTGGAVRLGRAIVEEFCSTGWRVAFTYKSSEAAARELVANLRETGGDALALRADVDVESEREALIAGVVDSLGGIDALVNNAAVFPRTPLDEISTATFAAVLRTNLEAPVFLTLAAGPHLRARRGAVVNIADIYGLHPLRHHLPYSVSKAALIAATRSLAVELAPEVRVNAVAPGIALFPESYDEGKRRRLLERTLLHRAGGPAEVAATVRFLVEGTDTMTGQLLVLDSGRTVAL